VPWLSDVAVAGDVALVRAKALRDGLPPRDAWMMECVQEDPSNPQPCSPADRASYPGGELRSGSGAPGPATAAPDDAVGACNPDFDDCSDAGARR
jgi:hypothetical protein